MGPNGVAAARVPRVAPTVVLNIYNDSDECVTIPIGTDVVDVTMGPSGLVPSGFFSYIFVVVIV